MKWLNTVGLLALSGVLVPCMVALSARLEIARSQAKREALENVSTERAAFAAAAGIDIDGHRVFDPVTAETKRVVALTLRNDTLWQDIEQWNAVEALIPQQEGLRIVAYCDGPECRAAVRQARKKPTFSVIAYGETMSSQAVSNADVAGQCLVVENREDRLQLVRKISWRPQRTPASLAADIRR